MNGQERLTKEPWLAVNLSWLVPGIGQFYAGARGLGLLFLLGFLALYAGVLGALAAPGSFFLPTVAFAGALFALWTINLFHAHACARKANSTEAEHVREQIKDPYLAVFFTQIVPGIGHLYLRRWVWGGVLILVTLMIWVFRASIPVLAPFVPPVYYTSACLLAYFAGPVERCHDRRGIVALCVLIVGWGLLTPTAALLCRAYVVEAFNVPTGAMVPTIMKGEWILAWKRPFEPRRGDVVVFINPRERSQNYVKRVAAVAGETIEVKRDGIYVAGTRLSEGVLGQHTNVEPLRPLEGGTLCAEEGNPVTVPPRHVFVLGDYINRSFDSRFFGPIPVEDIVGKAYKRYWPLDRAGPIE